MNNCEYCENYTYSQLSDLTNKLSNPSQLKELAEGRFRLSEPKQNGGVPKWS